METQETFILNRSDFLLRTSQQNQSFPQDLRFSQRQTHRETRKFRVQRRRLTSMTGDGAGRMKDSSFRGRNSYITKRSVTELKAWRSEITPCSSVNTGPASPTWAR